DRIIHERSGGGGGRARHDTAVLATAVNTSVCAAGAPSLARTLAKTAVSRHTLKDGVPFMSNAAYPRRRTEWHRGFDGSGTAASIAVAPRRGRADTAAACGRRTGPRTQRPACTSRVIDATEEGNVH